VRPDNEIERIRPIAQRVVESMGLELFYVVLRRESIGWVLRVVIDRPAERDADGRVRVEPAERSIGIDDCQGVSQDLSVVLDVETSFDVPYTLEVSSPGMDRPLRGEDDFRRFAGRLVKLVVKDAVDGQMHFEGRLGGVVDGAVVIEGKRGREKRIPLNLVARARLGVEF
jgi:ribosome maturation factor RimP